jgi:ribonuclease P protein component
MAGSVCSPSPTIRISHEKNVPALSKASCPPIRFSCPHGHEERSRDHQSSQGRRPETSCRCRNGPQVRPPHAGLGFVGTPQELAANRSFSAQASAESESLPRARVIRRRTVFEATRNKGRRVSSRWMELNFLSRDAMKSGETGTVAFLTPKRLGPATVRNKLRRRMREIYRRSIAKLDETTYLVWIARPPALELEFEELKRRMLELRNRLG